MIYRTHLVFAFLIGLLVYNYFELNKYLFFLFLLLGALIVDIDTPFSWIGKRLKIVSKILHFIFGHRAFCHSIFFILILTLIIWKFFYGFYFPFLIGAISHLFLDSLTREGINFTYPFRWVRAKGFIRTNKLLEKILFLLFIVIILIIIFI